jgi:hypothetical protein
MEIVILCACAFLAGMATEWIRESKNRRLLKKYRNYYEFPTKKRRK